MPFQEDGHAKVGMDSSAERALTPVLPKPIAPPFTRREFIDKHSLCARGLLEDNLGYPVTRIDVEGVFAMVDQQDTHLPAVVRIDDTSTNSNAVLYGQT